jgi:pyridoxal phosphate enzyme (YggS family)
MIGVSKTVERAVIVEACRLGLSDFGENRLPDMEAKFNPLPYPPGQGRLHLIGHLQSNKVKRAVALCDIIHSVDSLKLGQAINRQAQEAGKIIPVLLETNVSGEASKQGLSPVELPLVIAELAQLPALELRGLMTLAPNYEQPELTRPVFAALRELFERYHPGQPGWRDLSMGMSNDYQVAVEEGATFVRIGRALFDA